MKSTLIKSLIRMIRTTRTRFLAVFAIVTIGVAFFTGVAGTSRIMAVSVDEYNDENCLKDFTVYSNYGFDEEDVSAVRQLEEIENAEGAKFTDVIGICGKDSWVTRVHSFRTDYKINSFVLCEGRLPVNDHEALAERGSELEPGFALGSTVQVVLPSNEKNEDLYSDTFVIVGTVDTPLYLNEIKENSTLSNQYLRTYLYVLEDAFTYDYYTELNAVTVSGSSYNSFYNAYEDYIASVKESVERLASNQQNHRYETIREEALETYEEGVREYEEAMEEYRQKISDGEKELADGEAQIAQGSKELIDAQAQVDAAQNTLDEQVRKGQQQINEALETIRNSELTLEEKIQEFEKQKQELLKTRQTLADGVESLKQAKEGLETIDAASAQADEALEQLNDPKTVLLIQILKQLDEDMTVEELRSALEQTAEIADAIREVLPEDMDLPVEEAIDQINSFCQAVQDDYTYLRSEEVIQLIELLRQESPDTRLEEVSWDVQQLTETVSRYNPLTQPEDIQDLLDGYELSLERTEILCNLIQSETFETFMDALNEADLQSGISDLLNIDPEMIDTLISAIAEYTGETPQTVGELTAGYDQMVSGLTQMKEQLEQKRTEITDALAEQNIREDEIDAKIEEYENLIAQIDEGIALGEQQIKDAQDQLAQGRRQAADAQNQLDALSEEGRKQIAAAMAEIRNGRQRLLDASEKLKAGYEQLQEAKASGLQQLEDAKKALDEAKEQIDSLAKGKWTVLDRTSHYASATYQATVEQMAAIGRIFPLFFILVAALVCLTTMTRMVSEQRTETGVLRALGYTKMQCASRYLIYALSASAAGCIVGTLIGLQSFPRIIYNAWRMMYILPQIRLKTPWTLVIMTFAMFLGAMGITAYAACSADMREVPASLMRPKALKSGRRAWIERIQLIWNRLTFTWKVTLRNIFRYRRRFIMTVVGVAGCCGLMVTGFGIRDSVNSMVDLQFYEILQFDGTASLKEDITDEEKQELVKNLLAREDVESITEAYAYSAIARAQGYSGIDETVTVEIYQSCEDVKNTYLLRTRVGHQPLAIDDEGIIISEKLAENLGVGEGDVIYMEDEDGNEHEFLIHSVCEMYIQHHAFMSAAYYRSVCGKDPRGAALFITARGDEEISEKLQSDLLDIEEIRGISFFDETLANFSTMVKSLDLIVWTLIISSMLLAFVVLGNLIHINTAERQREIATLKVLGFRRKEVQSYIFKENNILTIIGALAGLPVGNYLHHYIMRCIDMDYVMFGRSVNISSFVISAVLTAAFGMIVNRFMTSSLDRIQMVESLKSVE